MINYSHHTLNQSKNFIPVISHKTHTIEKHDQNWDDGEIPWDIDPDNKTNVRISVPIKPITPLKFEQQYAFKYRIICALIE
jgi:hypothetical protein